MKQTKSACNFVLEKLNEMYAAIQDISMIHQSKVSFTISNTASETQCVRTDLYKYQVGVNLTQIDVPLITYQVEKALNTDIMNQFVE